MHWGNSMSGKAQSAHTDKFHLKKRWLKLCKQGHTVLKGIVWGRISVGLKGRLLVGPHYLHCIGLDIRCHICQSETGMASAADMVLVWVDLQIAWKKATANHSPWWSAGRAKSRHHIITRFMLSEKNCLLVLPLWAKWINSRYYFRVMGPLQHCYRQFPRRRNRCKCRDLWGIEVNSKDDSEREECKPDCTVLDIPLWWKWQTGHNWYKMESGDTLYRLALVPFCRDENFENGECCSVKYEFAILALSVMFIPKRIFSSSTYRYTKSSSNLRRITTSGLPHMFFLTNPCQRLSSENCLCKKNIHEHVLKGM